MAQKRNDFGFVVIKLNLLDGPKLIKRQVGISWFTFIVSIVLIFVLVAAPLLTVKFVNRELDKKVEMLNNTYSKLRDKEQSFTKAVKRKEEIMNFIEKTYILVDMQPRLSIVLDEVRKRLPRGTRIQGGVNLSVSGASVLLRLNLLSKEYLDVPQLIDAFSLSSYLYVEDAKVVPVDVSSVSSIVDEQNNKEWSYDVILLLKWKENIGEGEAK